MSSMKIGNDLFEFHRDMIDATSLSRPDIGWACIDNHDHTHRWYIEDIPAASYNPTTKYSLPTLRWIQDGIEYFEDGESLPYGHYECAQCGEKIIPGVCGDDTTQYIPGLASYRINGEYVSPEEFKRRYEERVKELEK